MAQLGAYLISDASIANYDRSVFTVQATGRTGLRLFASLLLQADLTFIDAVTEIFSALLRGHTLVVVPGDVVRNVAKFVPVCSFKFPSHS